MIVQHFICVSRVCQVFCLVHVFLWAQLRCACYVSAAAEDFSGARAEQMHEFLGAVDSYIRAVDVWAR